MNSLHSSSTCEDHLLEVLIDGEQGSQGSLEHISSCPDCRQQMIHFQQLVEENRDFLTPSSLQMQRIRANVWDKIEQEEHRGFWRQPAWASVVVLGCFMLLTLMAPRYFPVVARAPLDGASVYAKADSLEDMADQLLPSTAAAEPVWVSALSGGIQEPESMEHIDEMLELVIPGTGEQT